MQDHLKKKSTKVEEEKQLQEVLNQECNVKLLRREVIAIYNILTSLSYKLGDAELVIHKLLPKLEPYAAVDTNISQESHEAQAKQGLTLGKKVD